jgi:hypothetical protein
MKIATSDEAIAVDSWLGNKFQAEAAEITDVRLMADKAVPDSFVGRLSLALGRAQPEMKLRALMIWAGDRAVTLDAYHDKQFDLAVNWLKRHGWDVDSATVRAIETPMVRVTVSKH